MMEWSEEAGDKAEEAGDFETALRIYRHLSEKHKTPSYLVHCGRLAGKLRRWEEAEQEFLAALKLDSDFALTMLALGALHLERTDKEHVQNLEDAVFWLKRSLKAERSAAGLTFLGVAYWEMGRFEDAERAFADALAFDPQYEEAYFNLALLSLERDPERATGFLEQAIGLDPNYMDAHQELGKAYQRQGDLLKAEYHFRRCLEIDSIDMYSRLYLANCLAVAGKQEEADKEYERVIELHPEAEQSYMFFGNYLEATGRMKEANEIRQRRPKCNR